MSNDDAFYDQVAAELQSQKLVPGIWARAFAEANGKNEEARAFYIKYRVLRLKEEYRQALLEKKEAEMRERKEEARKEAEKNRPSEEDQRLMYILIMGTAAIICAAFLLFLAKL